MNLGDNQGDENTFLPKNGDVWGWRGCVLKPFYIAFDLKSLAFQEALGLKITMNIIKKFPNGMIFSHFKTLIC